MAYVVVATLSSSDKPLSMLAPTPEEAAAVAWDVCQRLHLSVPNQSWMVQEWDSFAAEYQDVSTHDCMVRGMNAYPKKTDFCVYVVDKLNKKHNNQFLLPAMTPEPNEGTNKFEMFRGKHDKVTIVFDPNAAEQSNVERLACKIDEAMETTSNEQEAKALLEMLEQKLKEAKESVKMWGNKKQRVT